uniref:Type IV conjugative transfer system protein TraV n=1 Tax=Escherichia coli TaxID=562 RepID=A0A2S1J9I3_ECOLX|nr:hypothetical protein KLDCFEIK_00038 [Escherichia coli]
MKQISFFIPLLGTLLLSGCAGTSTEFECNATTSDTCMTMEQANEKAKKLEQSSEAKPVAASLNRPGFPGECFICELRLPDQYFRWKHNKLFLLLPEEYGPAFPAIVDCYTSPPTLVWPVPLLSGFSNSYGVLPPLCKDH